MEHCKRAPRTGWVGLVLTPLLCSSLMACKEKRSAKRLATEGKPNLQKIFDGAKSYYEKGSVVSRSGTIIPLQFPASAPLHPPKPCGDQPKGQCTSTSWEDAPWKVIGFEVTGAHRLQYQFESDGEGRAATFTARAVIRDGKGYLVLEQSAQVDSEHRVVARGKPNTRRIKSLDAIRLSAAHQELARCRAYGFVPQLDARGVVVIKAGKVARAVGKGSGHCLKVWGRHCGQADFAKRWPKTCARTKKRLAGGQDI